MTKLLDEAIANKPRPWQLNKKFDIKEEKSVKPTGSVYRYTDDGVAIFASWVSANVRVTLFNFRSHVRGKYRFRISGYGFQSGGKPVNFHVTAGTLKAVTEERLVDYFAVPADKPTVIEFTEQTVRVVAGAHDLYWFSIEPFRLVELLCFCGLGGVLGVETGGEAEQGEEPLGVEEEGDLGDPPV